MLTALQKSITDNDTFVTYDYTGNDGTTIQYQLPSYDSVVNRLRAVEESINSLNSGKGTINLTDGTRRTISLSSIPHTPEQITGLSDPTTFTVDSNWFFEDLMFPGAQVEIDLTNQIEDTANRVRVTRIILNANDDAARSLWERDLSVNSYDYVSLKTILQNNNVPYYEDEETVELPLISNTVSGTFQITADPTLIDGNVWYTLDTLNYSTISSNGVNQGQNNILSVGDQLSYSDSIFEVYAIDQNNLRVRLKRVNGVQIPGIYAVLNFYQDPFADKTVKVRFGAHEYDILYFKGIAENYNLIADSWSTPVKFATDDLVLAGTTGLQQTPFSQYYAQYIVDWGSKMIAEAKEKKISAWYGSTPNAPTLDVDDFRVVQINTQINAAIDTMDVKNTAAEIESVKSQISSLKSTIAAQKTDLQSAVNLYTYNSIQQQIATNTTDLNNLQTTYSTLVDSFQTIVRENSAITTDPKYHIRGFFPIPEYKYQDEGQTIPEEIVGFDIAYRYIREDNTATQLNTFVYTAADGTEITGTYTDWNIVQGPMKTKVYDNDLQRYVWKSENVADGTETNINQIDIAISKGEKVEIKVRSISEAGYPENPLRSEWSNSVIVEFPSTLATSNEMADLITMVNDDALNITINNTLDSIGVTTHLDDTIPNSNSVNGMYFKHLAKNIAYEESGTTAEGTTVVNSISLQDKLNQVFDKVSNNGYNLTQLTTDISTLNNNLTEKETLYEEKFDDLDKDISAINASIQENADHIDEIRPSERVLKAKKYILTNDENTDEVVSLSSLDKNELFVLDKTTDTTNSNLSNVHAKDFYIHTDGKVLGTDGTQQSVTEKFNDLTERINLNKTDISNGFAELDNVSTRVTNIEATIPDFAKAEDVAENTSLINRIKDGDDILADDLFLGRDETKLSSNKTQGALYVFDSQSDEQLGILHVEDVNIHSGGYVTGTIISLSDMNDTLTDNTQNIEKIQDSLSTVTDTLGQVTYQTTEGWQLRANTATINTMLSANTVQAQNFVIENGLPFYALNGTNTAQLVAGHFKQIILHNNGDRSSDALDVYKTLQNVSTLLDAHTAWIGNVSTYITYDQTNPGAGINITTNQLEAKDLSVGTFRLTGTTQDYILSGGDSGITVKSIGSDNTTGLSSMILYDVKINSDQSGNSSDTVRSVTDYMKTVDNLNNLTSSLNEKISNAILNSSTSIAPIYNLNARNLSINQGTIAINPQGAGHISYIAAITNENNSGIQILNSNDLNNGNNFGDLTAGKIQANSLLLKNGDVYTDIKTYITDNLTSVASFGTSLSTAIAKINEIIKYLNQQGASIATI